jgi:hypothetical protein
MAVGTQPKGRPSALLAAPSQTSFNLDGRVRGVRVVIPGGRFVRNDGRIRACRAGFDCRVLEARARAKRQTMMQIAGGMDRLPAALAT